MAENKTKKVLITDTILRDAHQSQAATRMRIDEMIPVLSKDYYVIISKMLE